MTRKESNSTFQKIKRTIAEEGESLRWMVRAVIQAFLEAEMAEAVAAEKSERLEGRLSYRSGLLCAQSDYSSRKKLNCEFRKIAMDGFPPRL